MTAVIDPLDVVPDVRIDDAGPISRRFRDLGLMTFRAACRWVQAVPYAPNVSRDDPAVVFSERRGTCQSKHTLIAVLAQELELDVRKYIGAYRLDESVVDGAGDVLAACGLTFVPQMHCVLKYGVHFIDLTAGNCHGKKRDVTDMDVYFLVDPLTSQPAERRLYELAVRYYQQTDPALAYKSVEEVRRIAAACTATSAPCSPTRT